VTAIAIDLWHEDDIKMPCVKVGYVCPWIIAARTYGIGFVENKGYRIVHVFFSLECVG
jgi:hypothetical protein